MAIDDARGHATCRMWKIQSRGEGVCDGVVFPRVRLGAGYISGVITADEIDLAVGAVVTGTHKAAHVRHVRARAPCVGGDIVDSGGVAIHAGDGIFATKYINRVGRRVINRGSHDDCVGHGRQRSPRVGNRIVAVQGVQSVACGEGVAAGMVRVGPVGSTRSPVQVLRHISNDLPRRRAYAAGSKGGVEGPIRLEPRSTPSAVEQGRKVAAVVIVDEVATGNGGVPLGYEGISGRLAVKLRDAEKRDVARPRRKGQAACGERDMIIPRVREIKVRAGVQERAGVGSRPSRDVRTEQDIAGDFRAAHIEAEVLKVHVAVGWRRKRLSVCGGFREAKRVPEVLYPLKLL